MTSEITIGPLTASEWLAFALLDDDDRNPLPPCCANLSEARDAIFGVMRAGGDPDTCGAHLRTVWPVIESHLGAATGPSFPPTLRKLHDTYVADRPVPENREEGFARIFEVGPDQVRQFLAEIPKAWDVDTAEGRLRAATRIGGAFVARVYDPAKRSQLIRELARTVGMTYEQVALIVDAFRADQGLPYQPAEGVRVP